MNVTLTNRSLRLGALASLLMALIACSAEPTYERPEAAAAAAFKEELSAAELGTWKTAEPADFNARGEWWKVFEDPALDALEVQALAANQNLQAAAARIKEARGLSQSARGGLFPSIDGGVGATRQRVSEAAQPDGSSAYQNTMVRAQTGIAYEVDLFGRVSSSVHAAQADLEQSEALFRSVQLALQADVAQNYFLVRQLDAQAGVLADAVELREQALKLVETRFADSEIDELDVSRARAELATARSDAMTVARQRAAAEHSLAVLLGKAPSEFSLAAKPLESVKVHVPAGLPSALLERRPDIAAAERAMAAANARIGIAKAAFFPSLSLTGSAGFEGSTLGDLFNWSNRTFLLGPLAGTALNIPIFDGGRRSGNLAAARAKYEEDVANYRQQVLMAFREVEDNLSDLSILERQTRTQGEAVTASSRAADIARTQYVEGAVAYLDVIDAERSVLQAQRAAIDLQGVQAIATVNLIRALGGGWGSTGSNAVASSR
ncbi:efflux transporter outer membrane subunit [Pseudomonas nitroreducens]|uniref:efflux transporter outer membrane subunit n=1 Tax=Pseudomonas nitroreducens TaxID=46680 RepID=UPI0020A197EB|nr:efflux transporter outer membrane subunit [Pseudomonas nitroreducens]MCP1623664.1 multidrug efflux system outer membrane protein [Pseudomonas nitroreducens]